MTIRWIPILGTALSLIGSALAQAPASVPRPPTAMSPTPVVSPTSVLTLGPEGVPASAPVETEECGPIWLSADMLMSFFYGARVQPLFTTGPQTAPRSQAGVLNEPGTQVLFDGRMNEGLRSGVRVEGGYWFSPERHMGIEAGASVLESMATVFGSFNDGGSVLARPYFNVNTKFNESVLVTYPNLASGGVTARVSSGNFYEAHVDLVENWWDRDGWRIDGLVGYRFYRYDEGLRIRQISTITNDPVFTPTTTLYAGDDFSTQNEFHGAELGLRSSYQWDNLNIEVLGKVAVGPLRRRVKITGGQAISVPGSPDEQRPVGIFALPTNIGTYNYSDWSNLPELGITLRYRLNEYVCVRAGYNILFLNSISRADQQLDARINPNFFSGGTETGLRDPRATELRDNVWIMNIGCGLEVAY
ncbi:MAG: BBP7 family outer membrane beta-barrel protein [Gemmataceae bacterium]